MYTFLYFFVCLVCHMFHYAFVCVFLGFFFFKQKTAYEMRISDWSSDVCSSDLAGKAAIAGMTRWHAVSAAGRYRANAVAPGITRTPRLGDITAGAYGRDVLARTPLGRLGEAQDMARAILFLQIGRAHV